MMKLRKLEVILILATLLSIVNIFKVQDKSVQKKTDGTNPNVSLLNQPANKDFNQQDRDISSIPFLERERKN